MIAVRLSKQNLPEILRVSLISRERLESMVREYDQPNQDPIYFVPQHNLAHDLDSESWMTLPKSLLEEQFDFDRTKIDRVFVNITPK